MSFVFFVFSHTIASATSWVELKPEEVNKRAEVIVLGKYNFSTQSQKSKFIFQGYEFIVSKVYKGDAPHDLIAGIDIYDVGWAKDFQENGGEFLLFLEESEETDFLVPVAGPNGMIHIKDGKVMAESVANRSYYEKILNSQGKEPSAQEKSKETHNSPYNLFYLFVGATATIGLIIFIGYRLKSRR